MDQLFDFKILEVYETHPGISRSRTRNHLATVRAISARHAGIEFAKVKGFDPATVVGYFGTGFKIGNQEYEVAPA